MKRLTLFAIALIVIAFALSGPQPAASGACFLAGLILLIVSIVRRKKKPAPAPLRQPSVVPSPVPEPVPARTVTNATMSKISVKQFMSRFDEIGCTVFDTETTGLSPTGDRICEIAAIRFNPDGSEAGRFESLVDPLAHIPSQASAVSGITDAMLRGQPTIDRVLPDFLALAGDVPLIAYNADFDMRFLVAELNRCGIERRFVYADALAWAKSHYSLSSYKQPDVAAHLGLRTDVAHRAMADCETLSGIIADLMERESAKAAAPKPASKPSGANDAEKAIGNHFASVVAGSVLGTSLRVEHRSDDYASLCCNGEEIARVKYTPRAKWIMIDSYAARIDASDPLFDAQKNKSRRMWKAAISDISEIGRFDEYIVRAASK